ncbi:MAG: hypothetical protein FWD13_05750 [Treponema sp.]|nr:hypothetical protein [Treponema sp.]
MTITQTVEIQADRRLSFDIPREIPLGRAQVEIKVIPFVKKEEKSAANKPPELRLTKKELDEILQNAKTPISDSLTGILDGLGDITIEQIRDERLARHIQ